MRKVSCFCGEMVYDDCDGQESMQRAEEESEILLCPACAKKAQSQVLFVCENCSSSDFLNTEMLRKEIQDSNPDRPEISSWFDKLPMIVISEGCAKCLRAGTEVESYFLGIKIREGIFLGDFQQKSQAVH